MSYLPLKIINPISAYVAISAITSTNVLETVDSYDATAEYALGDMVLYRDVIYECIADSSKNSPSTDDWVKRRAAMYHRPFDGYIGGRSYAEKHTEYVFEGLPYVDSVAIFNITGTSVEIDVSSGGVSVYNEVVPIIDISEIDTFYKWYNYQPEILNRNMVRNDLPDVTDAVITITVHGHGTQVGEIIFGNTNSFGNVLLSRDTVRGVRSYAAIIQDEFGIEQIIDRDEYAEISYNVAISPEECQAFIEFIESRFGKFTVYYVDSSAQASSYMMIYGILIPPIEIPQDNMYVLETTLDVVGLT